MVDLEWTPMFFPSSSIVNMVMMDVLRFDVLIAFRSLDTSSMSYRSTCPRCVPEMNKLYIICGICNEMFPLVSKEDSVIITFAELVLAAYLGQGIKEQVSCSNSFSEEVSETRASYCRETKACLLSYSFFLICPSFQSFQTVKATAMAIKIKNA